MCIRHRPSQPLVAIGAHVLTDPWRVPRCALCREKGSEEHDSWTFLWLMSVPHTCCHVSYRPLVLDLTMCIWAMIGCRLCRHSKKRGSPQEQIYPWVSHVHKLQKFLVLTSGVPSRCQLQAVRIGESLGVRRFCPQGNSHSCVTLRCSSIGRRVCARIRTWQMSLDQNHQNMVWRVWRLEGFGFFLWDICGCFVV